MSSVRKITFRVPEKYTDTTPLRMEVAAALAFPDGSVGGRALYQLAKQGKLAHSVIANKHFTTLKDVEEYIARCHAPASEPSSVSKMKKSTKPPAKYVAPPSGLSVTATPSYVQAVKTQIAQALSRL